MAALLLVVAIQASASKCKQTDSFQLGIQVSFACTAPLYNCLFFFHEANKRKTFTYCNVTDGDDENWNASKNIINPLSVELS